MQRATHRAFVEDAWQTPRNVRTLRAFMALRQAEIGERIAKLRQQRGNPPQDAVAQKLDVSYRAYQSWEAGDSKPSYRNLEKLAQFYGVSEEYLLLGDEADGPPARGDRLDILGAKLDDVRAKLDLLLERVGGMESSDLTEEITRHFEAALQGPDESAALDSGNGIWSDSHQEAPAPPSRGKRRSAKRRAP